MRSGADTIAETRIADAHRAAASVVRRTPILTSATLSDRCGGRILLKAESLQRTGSFKLRGALNKLRETEDVRGVVAGSAGNHAQSLAYAARLHGIRCEVFMPAMAAVSKVAAVRAFGAVIHQQGDSVDDCVALARGRAAEEGLVFVHPFDDPAVIAGQAGLGIELVEDVRDLRRVFVPVGGGGLAAGVALAVKQRLPHVEVVGVQAAGCAPFASSLRDGRPTAAPSAQTIADGIAIKRPGEITFSIVERWLDDLVTVEEDAIAEAMVLLLERAKLVVEGAGAAGVAALLSGTAMPATRGATLAILSGGNVDAGLLAGIAARQETCAGRRMRMFTRLSDRPGGLARLLANVADAGANVIAVDHVRDGVPLEVGETGIDVAVETSGRAHADAVLDRLRDFGYEVRELH